jgi:hypothetical protein
MNVTLTETQTTVLSALTAAFQTPAQIAVAAGLSNLTTGGALKKLERLGLLVEFVPADPKLPRQFALPGDRTSKKVGKAPRLDDAALVAKLTELNAKNVKQAVEALRGLGLGSNRNRVARAFAQVAR